MKKVISFLSVIIILGLVVKLPQIVFLSQRDQTEHITPTVVTLPKPMYFSIPRLNIHAKVENVGLDKAGRMDVPKASENVGWYELGYKIGEKGDTVIAGHYDKKDGSPAVFYTLKRIRLGDAIVLSGDNRRDYTYTVKAIEEYPYNDLPLHEIFGKRPTNRLVVITCDGIYNQQIKTYSKRTVVFADL